MKGILIISALFLFVLISTSNYSFFSPELNQDYFYPRSGDLLVFSNTKISKENRARVVATSSKYQIQDKTINELDVASYFSHLLGLGKIGSESSSISSFPSVNYFEKPKAQLIFVLDSIDESLGMESIRKGFSTEVSTQTSSLSTRISFMTTLFSGSTISKHGIIANKWWNNLIGEYSNAYISESGEPYQPNLASLLSWVSRGESLISSYSSEPSVASVFSPHSKLISEEKLVNSVEHIHSGYFNEETNGAGSLFESIEGYKWVNEKDVTSLEKLVQVFKNLEKVQFSQQDNIITIQMGNLKATFDLTKDEDKQFLGQFAIISSILSASEKQQDLVKDNVPDLYTFELSGLRLCKGNSEKLQIVREMLNFFTSSVQNKLNQIYGSDEVVTNFLLTETHSECKMEKQKKQELAELLRNEIGSQLSNPDGLEETLPHVYLSSSLTLGDVNQIFFHIENILRKTDWMVHSPVDPLIDVFSRQSSDNSTSSSGDDTDLVVYQTSLWTTIALAFGVIMAVYFICCMDTGEDTIIYRPISHPHQG